MEEKLKTNLESGVLFQELKKMANGRAKGFKQKVKSSGDVKRLIHFIEKRKKEVERLKVEIPRDVKTVRSFLHTQRKELEKIGNQIVREVKTDGLNRGTLKSAVGKIRSLRKTGKAVAKKKKAAKRK